MKYAIVKEEYDPATEKTVVAGVVEHGDLREGVSVDADAGSPLYLKCGEVWLRFSSSEWASVEIVAPPDLSVAKVELPEDEAMTKFECPKCSRTHLVRTNGGVRMSTCQKCDLSMSRTEIGGGAACRQ